MCALFTVTDWKYNDWDGKRDEADVLGTFTSEDKALEYARAWGTRWHPAVVTVEPLRVDPEPVAPVSTNVPDEYPAVADDVMVLWDSDGAATVPVRTSRIEHDVVFVRPNGSSEVVGKQLGGGAFDSLAEAESWLAQHRQDRR
jgi:hypothetical protein